MNMQRDTNDMQKYIDASSILSEARMMQKDYNETYILIEGESDKTFFKTLVTPPPGVRFRPVNGWERVHNTILLSQQEGYTNILGIIDKDYHVLLQDGVTENEQLIFTDCNDIEMMLFCSTAFEKFLSVCADENKLKSQPDPRQIILVVASHLGALRVISLAKRYNFDFDGFECKDYINRNTLASDCNQLMERIIQRTRSKGTQVTVSKAELELEHQAYVQTNPPQSLCNGHDVLDILGIAMSKLFASASANQYTSDNLFDYLLMGYAVEEFQCSELYRKLDNWIRKKMDAA